MTKSESSNSGWYFLGISIIIYIILIIIFPDKLRPSMTSLLSLLNKILPVLLIVFIIMFLTNYFITPRWLSENLSKGKRWKSWFISVIAGIISTGPIYLWYPLLADIKEKGGIKDGIIATFLYARAIKPALIPLMVLYFGWTFTIVLTITMIFFSIIQGEIIDNISKTSKEV